MEIWKRLPRKVKKQWQKDNPIFWKCYYYSDKMRNHWEWEYRNRMVISRGLAAIGYKTKDYKSYHNV